MDFLKIIFSFFLSYRLRLFLFVCFDSESNPGPGSDRTVWVLYSNICGLRANLDALAVAGSDYVLVCTKSRVSDRCHLSELHIPGFGCPKQRLRNSPPGAKVWLFMLGKDYTPSIRASWSVLAMSLVCFIFAVG